MKLTKIVHQFHVEIVIHEIRIFLICLDPPQLVSRNEPTPWVWIAPDHRPTNMAHPIDSRHRNSASSTSSSRNSRNCSSASGIEVLRRRCYNTNGWSEWETLSTRDDKDFSFQFPNNTGELTIRKDFLNDERQQIIAQELMQQQKHLHLFRQYSFHSAQEPRVHFLLHSNATINPKMQQLQQQQKKEYKVDDAKTCDAYVDYHDDGAPQPGYRYGNIRMKAHSLQYLPHVEQLAQDLQSVFPTNTPDGEDDDSDCVNRNTGKRTDALTASTSSTAPACLGESWNIGVNPILYRSGKDYMGFHADDDQGEELIVTAVICCASRSLSDGVSFTKSRRCIRFQRKQRLKRNEKRKEVPGLDFELELWLQAGDVYSMDGTYCRLR